MNAPLCVSLEVNMVTTKFAVRSIARRYQRLSEKIFELDEAIESAGGRSRAGIGRRRGH
jgi:hypothetical protein